MSKPSIFISHVSYERDIAIALKNALDALYPDGEVFVSSVGLSGGTAWFSSIREALMLADVIVVSVSKKSQTDPWILFEGGAGLEKKKSIPVIWKNTTFADLVYPLAGLQGRKIDDLTSFKMLLDDIRALSGQQRSPWNEDVFNQMCGEVQAFSPADVGGAKPTKSLVPKTKQSLDQDILSLKEQLKRLNKQLVTKKLESIRPLYPNDIPATKELENMKFDEVQDLAAIVNAFSPIEILQIGSEFMFGVPSADESPIKKKKVTMDINQQIKGIRAIANQHKILLDE